MGLFDKLAAIQQELIAPKGQKNDFGKYNYRSCEDIEKALKPLLAKYKASVVMDGGKMENIGDRYYMTVEVHFVDLESGDRFATSATVREEESKKGMDSTQVSGACMSYARKYALAGLFLIDNEKDADTNEYTEKRKNAEEAEAIGKKKIGKNKIETLQTMINRDALDLQLFLELCKVKSLEDITENVFANVVAHWEEVKTKCPGAEVFK